MATTKTEIREWLERGKTQKATHLVVRVDTFDYEDYPVFCFSKEEARMKASDTSNMQRTMEVYDLNKDWDAQLAQHRVWNF
jgi:hypothetical protein